MYNMPVWIFLLQFETIGAGAIVGLDGQKRNDTSPKLENDDIPPEKLPDDNFAPDTGLTKRGNTSSFITKLIHCILQEHDIQCMFVFIVSCF